MCHWHKEPRFLVSYLIERQNKGGELIEAIFSSNFIGWAFKVYTKEALIASSDFDKKQKSKEVR